MKLPMTHIICGMSENVLLSQREPSEQQVTLISDLNPQYQ